MHTRKEINDSLISRFKSNLIGLMTIRHFDFSIFSFNPGDLYYLGYKKNKKIIIIKKQLHQLIKKLSRT